MVRKSWVNRPCLAPQTSSPRDSKTLALTPTKVVSGKVRRQAREAAKDGGADDLSEH